MLLPTAIRMSELNNEKLRGIADDLIGVAELIDTLGIVAREWRVTVRSTESGSSCRG